MFSLALETSEDQGNKLMKLLLLFRATVTLSLTWTSKFRACVATTICDPNLNMLLLQLFSAVF